MQLCALTAASAAAAQPQRHWLLLPQPIFDRLPGPAVFGLGIMAGVLAVAVARSWLRMRRPAPATRQAELPAPVETVAVVPPAEPITPPSRPQAQAAAAKPGPLVDPAVTASLLTDLEGHKVTLADGPPELVQALLEDAAARLAAGAIGPCELVLVGFDGASRETTAHCERVTAALDLVARRTVAARRRLADSPQAGPEQVATIIVSHLPPTASELSMLADLVSEPGRMAALLPAGPGRPGRRVERAAVLGLGYGDAGVVTTLRPAPAPAPVTRDAPAVLRIGVLGQLTINGQPGALLPAQTQLLVALALNSPAGLLNRQLCELLGSDSEHAKPADSLRQLIARTRRQLKPADDGREWIVHLGHGRYGLHENSRLDWAEFETLTDDGIASKDSAKLAAALAMIRGQPFTGCYYWWLDIELVEMVGAKILAAAATLAELALAARDAAGAGRAARVGLVADATAEPLWRLLMEAEHAAGNLAGVREAWSRCVEAISDIAADGQPDPATAALYRRLVSR